MESMDGARRAGGLLWVVGGVIAQAVAAARGVVPGSITLAIALIVVGAAIVLVLVPTGRGAWFAARLLSLVLGLDFAGAVADRFGALGAPGADGVSWGSWSAFVDYTSTLLPTNATHALVATAAVLATLAEIVLAVWLVSGREHRWAGKAAAGLLVVYLVTMWIGPGFDAMAEYAVPLLIGGALLASARPDQRGGISLYDDRNPRVLPGPGSIV